MARECFSTAGKLLSALRNSDLKPDYRVAVLDGQTLSIGPAPSPQAFVFDFETETLKTGVGTPSSRPHTPAVRFDDRDLPQGRAQRATGRYTFTHNDVAFARSSLADLLEAVLAYLEKQKPGALEKLSAIKKRTRRIVARDKRDLFDKTHLAKDHARMITGGWWMGTNNSSAETRNWIRQACDAAGIDFVTEVSIGI